MSEGNESEGEGLHPQSLTETINPEIVENAQTIESQQECLRPQSLTDTINPEIIENAQTIESLQECLRPQSLTDTINPEIVENAQTLIESLQEGLCPQSLTDTIRSKIHEDAEKTQSLFSSACIYRVPKELRKLNESAYTPRLIAIGPLHHNNEHLKSTPMQHIKGSYTSSLLLRLTEGERYRVLEDCVAEMKRSIDDAKKCYAEEVTLDEQMLLVDGCFIIELFYRDFRRTVLPPGVQGKADPILDSILTPKDIQMDLLLIENQIPFFVLDKLFDLTIGKIPNRPRQITLRELASLYFSDMILIGSKENSTPNGRSETANGGSPSHCALEMGYTQSSGGNYKHILHKVHCDCLPRQETKKTVLSEHLHMPSASDLDFAGVKFVRGSGNDLFKVEFNDPKGLFWWSHRASFEIPPLKIYDNTEAVLRNLIAFEQCCPGVSQHLITSYAILMDMLVNSGKDVERLEKARVIHNCLGSTEDATKLFNNLCKEIVIIDFFFADQFNKATKYSKRIWPKNMAHLRRKYFASPWTFIAFCLGFIVSGMSISKFIYSFLD